MKNRKLLRQRRNAFWSALYAAVIYALFYIPVLVMIHDCALPQSPFEMVLHGSGLNIFIVLSC